MSEIDVEAIRRKNEIAAAQKLSAPAAPPRPEPGKRPFAGNRYVNADGTRKQPVTAPKADEGPMGPRTHPEHADWIAVERVAFSAAAGAVDIPGSDLAVYRGSESVVARGTLGKPLLIWLSPDDDEFILEHPTSKRRERVPRFNVRSYRRCGDVPPVDSTRPTGLVTRLPDEPEPKPRRGW